MIDEVIENNNQREKYRHFSVYHLQNIIMSE